MTKMGRVAICAGLLLLGAEFFAFLVERAYPVHPGVAFEAAPYRMVRMSRAPWPLNREGFHARELETYRHRFLVEFLGGSACLAQGIPEGLEQQLHRAGLARASVLNLCQAGAAPAQELAIFLEYGLPLAPQVVLSFDGAEDFGRPAVADVLAIRRLAARLSPEVRKPNSQSVLNSYLYTTEVVRTLTQAQGGWYGVVVQASSAYVPTLDALARWSGESGAPVFGATELDRQGLFQGIADRYRVWERGNPEESARSFTWPR